MEILTKATYEQKEKFLLEKNFIVEEYHWEMALDEAIINRNLINEFKKFLYNNHNKKNGNTYRTTSPTRRN